MADTESPDTSDYTDTPSATPRLLGDLKTQLRWDLSSSNLHVDVRQILESTRSMEVKYKGCLNTSTGSFEYRGLVRKNFYTNTPSIAKVMAKERDVPMEGADQMDLDRFLPAGVKTLFFRDWSISPGVALTSKPNQKFSYLISLRKQPQVGAVCNIIVTSSLVVLRWMLVCMLDWFMLSPEQVGRACVCVWLATVLTFLQVTMKSPSIPPLLPLVHSKA